MSDISPRRRLIGRAAIATAFLTVPLTASIVYAEDAPSVLAAATQAAEVEEWNAAEVRQKETAPDVQIDRQFEEAERDLAEAEHDFNQAEREVVEIEREIEAGEDREIVKRKIRYNGKDWSEMSETDRAKFREEMAELREKFGENGELREEMRELRRQFGENGEMRREIRLAVAEAQAGAAHARAMAPKVVVSCKEEYSPVSSQTDADGKTTLFVCETAGDKIALRAMKQARATIANERSLSAEERAEALRSLDEEIADLERAN